MDYSASMELRNWAYTPNFAQMLKDLSDLNGSDESWTLDKENDILKNYFNNRFSFVYENNLIWYDQSKLNKQHPVHNESFIMQESSEWAIFDTKLRTKDYGHIFAYYKRNKKYDGHKINTKWKFKQFITDIDENRSVYDMINIKTLEVSEKEVIQPNVEGVNFIQSSFFDVSWREERHIFKDDKDRVIRLSDDILRAFNIEESNDNTKPVELNELQKKLLISYLRCSTIDYFQGDEKKIPFKAYYPKIGYKNIEYLIPIISSSSYPKTFIVLTVKGDKNIDFCAETILTFQEAYFDVRTMSGYDMYGDFKLWLRYYKDQRTCNEDGKLETEN